MGTVVSMLGMYFSVQFDLPTGATIVCTFGLVLMIMAAARPLIRRPSTRETGVMPNAALRSPVG
ncbi:hypothetical protein D3C83_214680 [compost metagenome]